MKKTLTLSFIVIFCLFLSVLTMAQTSATAGASVTIGASASAGATDNTATATINTTTSAPAATTDRPTGSRVAASTSTDDNSIKREFCNFKLSMSTAQIKELLGQHVYTHEKANYYFIPLWVFQIDGPERAWTKLYYKNKSLYNQIRSYGWYYGYDTFKRDGAEFLLRADGQTAHYNQIDVITVDSAFNNLELCSLGTDKWRSVEFYFFKDQLESITVIYANNQREAVSKEVNTLLKSKYSKYLTAFKDDTYWNVFTPSEYRSWAKCDIYKDNSNTVLISYDNRGFTYLNSGVSNDLYAYYTTAIDGDYTDFRIKLKEVIRAEYAKAGIYLDKEGTEATTGTTTTTETGTVGATTTATATVETPKPVVVEYKGNLNPKDF